MHPQRVEEHAPAIGQSTPMSTMKSTMKSSDTPRPPTRQLPRPEERIRPGPPISLEPSRGMAHRTREEPQAPQTQQRRPQPPQPRIEEHARPATQVVTQVHPEGQKGSTQVAQHNAAAATPTPQEAGKSPERPHRQEREKERQEQDR
jgi:hypothetical protein